MSRFGLLVELSNIAPAQTTINNFNSVCRLGGQYLAANENGIYRIMHCASAGGANIDAHFKIWKSDFGITNQKRLRRIWIGYESSGTLKLTVTADDKYSRPFILDPVHADQSQHMNELNMSRELKGAYFDFKFENINGEDFSIDKIVGSIMILGMKARGAKIWA